MSKKRTQSSRARPYPLTLRVNVISKIPDRSSGLGMFTLHHCSSSPLKHYRGQYLPCTCTSCSKTSLGVQLDSDWMVLGCISTCVLTASGARPYYILPLPLLQERALLNQGPITLDLQSELKTISSHISRTSVSKCTPLTLTSRHLHSQSSQVDMNDATHFIDHVGLLAAIAIIGIRL